MRLKLCLGIMILSTLILSACVTDDSAIGEVLLSPGKSAVDSAQIATVADFAQAYSDNAAKANREYTRKWVKLRGIVTDVRKIEVLKGTGSNDYYIVSLKDDTKKTKEIMTCRFNFNKRSDVELLKAGSVATILGQVDELGNTSRLPMLMNSSLVK